MRFLALLLALAAASPAFAQASDAARTGRSASLPLPVRPHAAPAEVLPPAAIYSWVEEADGRYVVSPSHDYLTPEQRTAWASGADDEARLATLAATDAEWPGTPVVTCDVLKCVQASVPAHPVRPATRS